MERRQKENLSKVERNQLDTPVYQRRRRDDTNPHSNERNDKFFNNSAKSSSKYSVPEGENYGEAEFVVKTQNNFIRNDGFDSRNEKFSPVKSGNKPISISKMQNSFKGLQNTANYSQNENVDSTINGSNMNASQQQAINMINGNLIEVGIRNNTQNILPPHLSTQNDILGASTNSRSGSRGPSKYNQSLDTKVPHAPKFGGSSNVLSPFESTGSQLNQDQNQAMNPLLSSMVMLMQQNTALLAQQQEFMKNFSTNQTTSRSRSRSKRRRDRGRR